MNYSGNSLDSIYRQLMLYVGCLGQYESAPRGKRIREELAASFTLTDPRNRLIVSPARNVNYGFAVGELCWYVRGDTDLKTMLYYNRRMAQFSDDGETINSAYGARLFNPRFLLGGTSPDRSRSQVDNVIEELARDPDSRRAVMHINDPWDLLRAVTRGSKDVPCTMSLQLFIRERRLHMHVLMRSNDLVWGVPYDVFSFTCLQEAFLHLLQEAGAPVDDLGHYHHTAGSLHVYDNHWGMAREVADEPIRSVPPMKPFTSAGLDWLANRAEPLVRSSVGRPGVGLDSIPVNPDVSNIGVRDGDQSSIEWMVGMLVDHRDKRVIERQQKEKDEQA